MCAILGASVRDQLTDADLGRCVAARELLAHRGPDAHGTYTDPLRRVFLGHNRLSIIDLDPRSNQPFRDGNLVITFNGEIYNYRELRDELVVQGKTLRTSSDTEVIVLLYRELGVACLEKLRGMFAFCIYDEESKELFCARDRMGEKPLVYAETPRGFVFASEIPGLFATGLVEKKIDETALPLYELAALRRVPEPFSLWKGVKKMRPATYLRVRGGKIIEEKTYWHVNPAPYSDVSPRDVRDAVCKAVELTSVADVPVSVLLSGGTDSSIIAAVMKRELGAAVTGYVFGRDKDDEEVKRAREVAKLLDMPLKEYYFAAEDIKAELRALIAQNGEPFYLLPLAYASVLFRHIREDGMKVVLAGNGADELWYGYTSHPRTLLASYIARALGKRNNWPVKRGRLLKTSVGRTPEEKIIPLLDDLFAAYADLMGPAHDRLYIDFSNLFALFVENAHSITFQADLAGMRNSIEVRSPFLDHRLVELAWHTHPRKKIRSLFDNSGTGNKLILKQAFQDILPHEVLFRKKMGFGFNVSEQSIFGADGTRAYAAWSLEQWRTIFS